MTYRHFTLDEFKCRFTGKNEIDPDFVEWLDGVRHTCDFPFKINSGYRGAAHPLEARKPDGPGPHNRGRAADISCTSPRRRFLVIKAAVEAGCKRIGIAKTYVHLDMDTVGDPEVVWLY